MFLSMLKEELTILFTWVDSLSSESMYTPKFLTTAELVILSSSILMGKFSDFIKLLSDSYNDEFCFILI